MRRPRNSDFLPVSGWVRTIGWRAPGTFYTSSTLEALMRLAAARMGGGVDHGEAVDALLGRVGQVVIGAVAIEERGRAAGARRRAFERAQQAGGRRHVDKRRIGVPERLAVAQAADRLAVLDDVGDDGNFRRNLAVAAVALGVDAILFGDQRGRVEFEFAELAGERHVLRVGHRRPAEAQHEVVEPGLADRAAIWGRERLAYVDAGDVGAAAGGEGVNFNCHGSLLVDAR